MPRSKLPSLSSITDGSFEPNRKNPIMLGDDSQLGSELKPIKIGGKTSILELSETSLRISGDIHDIHTSEDFLIKTDGNLSFDSNGGIFEFVGAGDALLTWNSAGILTFVPVLDKGDSVEFDILNGGNLKITTNDDGDTLAHIFIEPDGHIGFTSKRQGYFYFSQESNYSSGGGTGFAANYLRIHVAEDTGATEFLTVDADAQVGHMTFKPDGDLILDPETRKTIINATDGLYFDGGGDTYIQEGAADRLDFYVGGTLMLQIKEAVANSVVHINAGLTIDAAKKLWFDGSILGNTYIYESAADILDFYVGAKNLLKLDKTNDRITLATGKLVAAIANGTEYSATDSAYAGMILGYTCVGANVADDSYTLTTSFVCFQDSGGTPIRVIFKTPPSEYVEIEAELYFSAGSGASDLELTLSDNAVYGGNSLTNPAQFDKSVREPARGHSGTVTQKWFLQADNLEAIGSDNSLYIAAKCDSTSGTPIIKWGGDASGEYTNLVIKAVALPAAITEGS